MDPTVAQAKLIKRLRDTYGTQVVQPHAPDPKTGILRVELTCAAGVHQWYFNTDGVLVNRTLTQRLFDPPEPPRNPRNAIDN